MGNIIVERVEEFTSNIKRYEVITQQEAIEAIDNFNIAEKIVDDSIYERGYTIEIDLKTGEIYATIDDGTFSLGDSTTIRLIYHKKAYYDFIPVCEAISEYDEFEEFRKQYSDWVGEVKREYDYEFNNELYNDEYEAFIVEVLGEDIDEFSRNYFIEILECQIDCDIYEDTFKFYKETKIIEEL